VRQVSVLKCASCGETSNLKPYNNETLGECAYRAGWRARPFGHGWKQFCAVHAPPDEDRPGTAY
jgi:hypothetical protein